MPLYEYGCSGCGTVSEISHRLSEPSPTDCPVCGAPKLSKLISAAGFRLKGEGWYETDFKSNGKKNLAGDTPPVATADAKSDSKPVAVSKPEAGTATKTESKPAAAAAAPSAPSSSAT
jgi:putative FmdB family regulatory protein